MSKREDDFIVDPYKFNDLVNLAKEVNEKLAREEGNNSSETTEELNDLKERLDTVESYLQLLPVNTDENYTVTALNSRIIVCSDCTERELEVDVTNLRMGQKITISKMDNTTNKLKIVTTGDVKFWTDKQFIYLTSQYDTVSFIKITENIIVGI